MQVIGSTQRTRQRKVAFRIVVSVIGLSAILVLLYLISHLQVG